MFRPDCARRRFCSRACFDARRVSERLDPEWFWRQTDKHGPVSALGTRCWLWTGEIARHGYGRTTIDHRRTAAHRHAWTIAAGAPPPDGMEVCHRCDNPPCCNPSHLFLGTQSVNHADMVSKRRHALGERDGCAKLTEDDVRAIRRMDGSALQRDIARRFGVSKQTVSKIVRGDRWGHLPTDARAAKDRRGARFGRKGSGNAHR